MTVGGPGKPLLNIGSVVSQDPAVLQFFSFSVPALSAL